MGFLFLIVAVIVIAIAAPNGCEVDNIRACAEMCKPRIVASYDKGRCECERDPSLGPQR